MLTLVSGALLLGEPLTLGRAGAAAVALLGVALVVGAERGGGGRERPVRGGRP